METLLIIGGTGSLGNSLVFLLRKKYKIVIISRDENKQWLMKQKYPDIRFFLGDIRDRDSIEEKLYIIKPHKILIVSALKHIDICEYNISECIKTNVLGIQNIIDIVVRLTHQKLLSELNTICFISTDKAVSPVNVYGMCKSLGERIVTKKSLTINSPKFIIVRYGNVLNSRGSILPKFHEIGKDKTQEFFPVTHEDMTRFFIKLEEGVKLIERAMNEGENGDIFVPIIPSYRIMDIAHRFSTIYKKPIKIVGIRPGEKIHECLINESEKYRTIKKDNIYIIKPSCYINIKNNVDFDTEYNSKIAIHENSDELDIKLD